MKKKIGFGALCFLIALGVSILLTQPDVKDTASKLKTNYIEATTVEEVSDPFSNLIEEQKQWFIHKLNGS
ncbi:hypothetical protein [Paenilisteria rocourtiae]|uniref:Uncharacterized protein n=1 Tax=Listeria rocourtiae TaxID=647910 RepID=A0A4R6ZSD7_9LIST|nr:hypothetical protein [Listeria rocourtiae]EUJ43833.1 hypothetical protein PROCOU_14988 [Listeria rocourtiae FSL F6-920]MBC1435724.1 hypothetical protein [Listeria rocourtiae]MBC1605579.1 hypothetical protein [Listeria rocourtiae]TDR55621.1 hypothetical protein DFP96_101563 [Listeria rocourtiae]